MKLLKKIIEYPGMLRRSKGYGVHSPFAYNFITKVIEEKEAEYYAYAEIAAFCPRARKAGINEIFAGKDMSVPEAWLLFRVLCHFNPPIVIEVGHGHEVTNIILERAVPKSKVLTWHEDRQPDPNLLGSTEPFILINQFSDQHEPALKRYIAQLMEAGDSIYFLRNLHTLPQMTRIWDYLTSDRSFGMGFTDGYTGIFAGRHKLPHDIYRILM